MPPSVERAREILSRILYVTLATCDRDGQPWNSPVFTAYDEQWNFYWTSTPSAQHSLNIAANPRVFIVVYDSLASEGLDNGVYFQATARALSDPVEIGLAVQLMYDRKSKPARPAESFLGEAPRRVYCATPVKCWMNTYRKIDGFWLDGRVEIPLPG